MGICRRFCDIRIHVAENYGKGLFREGEPMRQFFREILPLQVANGQAICLRNTLSYVYLYDSRTGSWLTATPIIPAYHRVRLVTG